MNGAVTEPKAWSKLKLLTITVIAATVQAGLIYWASDRNPFHPRTALVRPTVQLAALAHNELLGLTDPTIFSHAHADGFSGPAWLSVQVQPIDSDTNAAPQQWLALASAQLGATFRDYVRTNEANPPAFNLRPRPILTQPGSVPALAMAKVSTVELKDALAQRALVNFPPLPAQTNTDILLPSEVQVLVDGRGNPISAVLLRSSGIKSADQLALTLARSAQFTPTNDAPARNQDEANKGVVWGRVVFHWYTVPSSALTGGAPDPR